MQQVLNTVPPAVWASLIAALVATLGLAAVLVRDGWAQRNQIYFTAFAAGILITTALMLFPEALASTQWAPLLALAGYASLYGLNLLTKMSRGAAITPLLAIGLHSFIDGFEYGILFDHGFQTGLIASIGLIAHEFAEGVILFALMRAGGAGVGWSMLGAFFGAALTTPLGAVASQSVLADASPQTIGMLLAAACGALLYLGATHLPMHINRSMRINAVIPYLAGIALAVGLSLVHTHDHGAHDHDTHEHEDEADHDHEKGEHDHDDHEADEPEHDDHSDHDHEAHDHEDHDTHDH